MLQPRLFTEIDQLNAIKCIECTDSGHFNCLESIRDNNLDNLLIFHLNIRSYRKNIDDVLILLQSFKIKFDLIVLGEAWLSEDIVLENLDAYNVFTTTNKRNKNDGVIIYVHKRLNAAICEVDLNGVYGLRVDFRCFDRPCSVLAVYRTHDTSMELFIEGLRLYYDALTDDTTHLFLGDINCNIGEGTKDRHADGYLDVLYEAGFVCGIDKPTRVTDSTASTIDHIFVKHSDYSVVRTGVVQTTITDHYAVFAQLTLSSSAVAPGPSATPATYIDYQTLARLVREQDWAEVLGATEVNRSAESFIALVSRLFEKSKKSKTKCSAKFTKIKPWITLGIIRSIRNRDRLSKILKKQPFNQELRDYYRRYRNRLTVVIRNAKREYYRNKINASNQNPKVLWETINEIRGLGSKKEEFPVRCFMDTEQNLSEDSVKSVANNFNKYFSNVGSILAGAISPVGSDVVEERSAVAAASTFMLHTVTEADVSRCISQMRGASAPGPDGVQTNFLKENLQFIVRPLTHIINVSITSSVFPCVFKTAKVIPVFKSESKYEMINYRPISLLNVCSKVLEKIVKEQLVSYLSSHNILCEEQYGFRSGRDISDALFDVTKEVKDAIEKNQKILLVFIDLAKAFDSIDRAKLLSKMQLCGIKGDSLNWFSSYLKDRKQTVSICGVNSDTCSVDYGVIQGSTLGPVLFLIYINNISKIAISGKLFLFADDTAILFRGKGWDEIYAEASRDLSVLKRWFDQNVLTLNVKKTKCMALLGRNTRAPEDLELTLHTCGDAANQRCDCEMIERVNKYKYLGVVFDHRMSWDEHVSYIKAKIRKMVYVFSQFSLFLNEHEIRQAYFAYIQSTLQFGIIAWGGAGKSIIEPLLIAQKSILKASFKKPRMYSSDLLFAETKVLDIRQLYIKSILLFMFKNRNSIFEPVQHVYPTRNSTTIGIQTQRLVYSSSALSAHYVAQVLYRNVPPCLREMGDYHASTYKKRVTQWLLNIGRVASENLLLSIYRN